MKMSEVKEVTETIKGFTQRMTAFENKMSNEAPWVWNSIQYSLGLLSEVNIVLEGCSAKALDSILADYAPLFRANGIDISKLKKLPKGISEQDVEVDLNLN